VYIGGPAPPGGGGAQEMSSQENNKDVFMMVEGGSLRGLSDNLRTHLTREVLLWQTLTPEDIEGRVVERKIRNKITRLPNPHVCIVFSRSLTYMF
jgi:hypothetical protein